MEIKTRFFGTQTIDPDSIITFPEGIPGFENFKRYKLFNQEGNDKIYWLQSIDDERLSFSVTHPGHFNINYSFELSDQEQTTLHANESTELAFLILLHEQENETDQENKPVIKGSINSPLVINTQQRIGIQKNLHNAQQSITLMEEKNEINVSEP